MRYRITYTPKRCSNKPELICQLLLEGIFGLYPYQREDAIFQEKVTVLGQEGEVVQFYGPVEIPVVLIKERLGYEFWRGVTQRQREVGHPDGGAVVVAYFLANEANAVM